MCNMLYTIGWGQAVCQFYIQRLSTSQSVHHRRFHCSSSIYTLYRIIIYTVCEGYNYYTAQEYRIVASFQGAIFFVSFEDRPPTSNFENCKSSTIWRYTVFPSANHHYCTLCSHPPLLSLTLLTLSSHPPLLSLTLLTPSSPVPQDEKLTKEEVLQHQELFVGSQATDFGDYLVRHDEF